MSAVMESAERVDGKGKDAADLGRRIIARETAGNLLRMVDCVSGVIGGANVLPILTHVRLSKCGEELRAMGSDLSNEMEVVTTLGYPDSFSCATTVSARKLTDILKSFPVDAQVKLELQGSTRMIVASGRSRLSVMTLPAQDFPDPQEPGDLHQAFMAPQRVLKRLLKATGYGMAHQDVRSYLCGVLLCSEEGKVRCVATNGHRLVMDYVDVEGAKSAVPVILPRKCVLELLKILRDVDDMVRVNISHTMATFCFEGERMLTVSTRLLEGGKYPDWRRVMPKASDIAHKVTVDRAELLAAVQRISLLASEKFKAARMRFSPDGTLAIEVQNEGGESAEDNVQIEGWTSTETVEVGLNLSYLAESVSNMVGDNMTMGVRSNTESVVMCDSGDPNLRAILMPVRM